MRRVLIAAVAAIFACLGLAAPAVASEPPPSAGHSPISAFETSVECEQVSIKFTNNTAHPHWQQTDPPRSSGPATYWGDVRVDSEPGETDQWSTTPVSEGPLAGQVFGLRYRSVEIPAGTYENGAAHPGSAVWEHSFEPGSGEHLVEFRVARGPEQRALLDWLSVTVDCGEPEPPKDGKPGPVGPAGPQGPPGEDGKIVKVDNDIKDDAKKDVIDDDVKRTSSVGGLADTGAGIVPLAIAGASIIGLGGVGMMLRRRFTH